MLTYSKLFVIIMACCAFSVFGTPVIGQPQPLKPGDFEISLNKGLISLDANDAKLKSILRQAAKQDNVEIKNMGAEDFSVTASFKDMDFEALVRRLIKNYVLVEGKRTDGSVYKELFVSSRAVADAAGDTGGRSLINAENTTALSESKRDRTALASGRASQAMRVDGNRPSVESLPNELLVRFSPNAKPGEIEALNRTHSGTVLSKIDPLNIYRLGFPEGSDLRRIQSDYTNSPLTETIEPNYIARVPEVKVNDPQLGGQWELEKMRVPEAWNVTMGSSSVIVATLDTGIDVNHPDLADRVVKGYNVLTHTSEIPLDDNGHGTQIAGIIAAEGNNGTGVSGICPNCKILPVKVLDGQGAGSYTDLIEGLIYAADHGAQIVNMSLGGYGSSKMLSDAVQYAHDKNVVLVAAAGNEGTDQPCYPAALPGVLGVTATGPSDERWSGANFGDYVDLSAPGIGILTTSLGGGYSGGTGTSYAAAAVSGVSALLKAQGSGTTNTQMEKKLQSTADDLGDKGLDKVFGAGRVNAMNAVHYDAP